MLSEIALAVLVFAASLIETAQPLDPSRPIDFSAGGWIWVNVLSSAAILLRRRAPALVLIGLGLAGCLLITVGLPPLISPIVVVLYSVAVYASIVAAAAGAAILYGVFLTLQIVTGQLTSQNVTAPVALVIALLLGLSARNRRKYLAAVVDRAQQLTRERDQQARLATAAERSRIARELHDVVAHSLSVMIRLSDGAAAVASVDAEQASAASRQVSAVGRVSLSDMRRLLGVLGQENEIDQSPRPRLGNLEELAKTYRSAGLPVTLEMVGAFPTNDGIQLVIYRVVQEALTNALRYADRPSLVEVSVVADAAGVTIDVVDDGRLRRRAASEGTQRGLIGLRERAAMYGGALEAGPRGDADDRGWSVHVTLPQAKEEK